MTTNMIAKSGVMHRCWVNQPSVNQKYHHLHGRNVLCDFTSLTKLTSNVVTIYFIDGDIISQVIDRNALSMGWL